MLNNSVVQDWRTLTMGKDPKHGNKKKPNATSSVSQEMARTKKLEQDENFTVESISRTLAQEIKDLRTKKGWTQKQLALAINERPVVIAQWEAGKSQPNGALLVKMRKALK